MEVPNHIVAPDGIEFRVSEMDPTQMGAWSTKPIPKETFLGPYVGDIIRDGEESKVSYRFAWEIFNLENGEYLYTINATDPAHGNWMRYVNCARYLEEQNLVSVQKDMEMFYKAIKDIEPGEELLTWYQPFKKRRKKKIRSPVKSSPGKALIVELDDDIEGPDELSEATPENGSSVLGKRQRVKKKQYDDIILMADLIPKRRRRSKAEVIADKEAVALDERVTNGAKKRGRKKKNSVTEVDREGNVSPGIANNSTASSKQSEVKKKGRKKSLEFNSLPSNLTEHPSDQESSASSESFKHTKGDALVSKPKTPAEIKELAEIEASWKYPSPGREYQFEHLACYAVTKNGRRFYKCDVCSGIYRHTFSLKRHYLRNHINCRYLSKADLVNCLVVPAQQWLDTKHANDETTLNKCGQKLESATALSEKYNENCEVTSPGLYRCCICNKLYDDLETLKEHTQNHPATPHEKFFGCDQCKMRFTFHQNLLRHKLVHDDDGQRKTKKKKDKNPPSAMGHFNQNDIHGKPYKCRICPMKFRYQSNLEKHHKIHSSDNWYDCSICGKQFPNETNLKKHMVIHVGSTVYCKYCVQKFSHVGTLRKHIRIEHPLIHKERILSLLESRGNGGSEAAAKLRFEIEKLKTEAKKVEKKAESEVKAKIAVKTEKETNVIKIEKNENAEINSYENKDNEKQGPGRFRFACVVCKKRFSAYVNMCRHRRMAHKDYKDPNAGAKKEELRTSSPKTTVKHDSIKKGWQIDNKTTNGWKRLKDAVKKPAYNPPDEETPEAVQEFYANVAANIADNLNLYIDGGASSLDNSKSYIKIENYEWEPLINEEATSDERETVQWEQFNFPPNYNPSLIYNNFQFIEQRLEDDVKHEPEKLDKKILEELAPALCTRRRSSSEWIALAEFSKNDSNHGDSPLIKEYKDEKMNEDRDRVKKDLINSFGEKESIVTGEKESHVTTMEGTDKSNEKECQINTGNEAKDGNSIDNIGDNKENEASDNNHSREITLNESTNMDSTNNLGDVKESQDSKEMKEKQVFGEDTLEQDIRSENSVGGTDAQSENIDDSSQAFKLEQMREDGNSGKDDLDIPSSSSNTHCKQSTNSQQLSSNEMEPFTNGLDLLSSAIDLLQSGSAGLQSNSVKTDEPLDSVEFGNVSEVLNQTELKSSSSNSDERNNEVLKPINSSVKDESLKLCDLKDTSFNTKENLAVNSNETRLSFKGSPIEQSEKCQMPCFSEEKSHIIDNGKVNSNSDSQVDVSNSIIQKPESSAKHLDDSQSQSECSDNEQLQNSNDIQAVSEIENLKSTCDNSVAATCKESLEDMAQSNDEAIKHVLYKDISTPAIKHADMFFVDLQKTSPIHREDCIALLTGKMKVDDLNINAKKQIMEHACKTDSIKETSDENGVEIIGQIIHELINKISERGNEQGETEGKDSKDITKCNACEYQDLKEKVDEPLVIKNSDCNSLDKKVDVVDYEEVVGNALKQHQKSDGSYTLDASQLIQKLAQEVQKAKDHSVNSEKDHAINNQEDENVNDNHGENLVNQPDVPQKTFSARGQIQFQKLSALLQKNGIGSGLTVMNDLCQKKLKHSANIEQTQKVQTILSGASVASESSGVMSLELFTDSENESDIFSGLALSKKSKTKRHENVKLFDIKSDQEYSLHSPFHDYTQIEFGKNGSIVNVCSVCKKQFEDTERLLRHQWKKHPSIHCHYLQVEHGHEIEYLFYSEPSNKGVLGVTGKALENVNDRGSFTCTRCRGIFKSVDRLRVHIINCAPKVEGTEPVVAKPKYRRRYQKHRKILIKSNIDSPVKRPETPDKKVINAKEISPKLRKQINAMNSKVVNHVNSLNIPEKDEVLPLKSTRRKKSGEMGYNPMNHIRRRELTEILDTHQCKGCGVKFNSISLLERHVKKCDGKEKFKDLKVMKSNVNDTFHQRHKHLCLYCNRGFAYPKTLMNHYKAFCLVKKDKVAKGMLTEVDKQQESIMMLKLKQQEEDRCFTDIPEEHVIGKKGWPRGMKRKWKRKNHCWTYIKKRKPSTDEKNKETSKSENEINDISSPEQQKEDQYDVKNADQETPQKLYVCNEKGKSSGKKQLTPQLKATPGKSGRENSPKKTVEVRQKRKYVRKKIFTFDGSNMKKRGRKPSAESVQLVIDSSSDSVQSVIDSVANSCEQGEENKSNNCNNTNSSPISPSIDKIVKNEDCGKQKASGNFRKNLTINSPGRKRKMSVLSAEEKYNNLNSELKVDKKTKKVKTGRLKLKSECDKTIGKQGEKRVNSRQSSDNATPLKKTRPFCPQKRLKGLRRLLADKLELEISRCKQSSEYDESNPKKDLLAIRLEIVRETNTVLDRTAKELGIPIGVAIDEEFQKSLTKQERLRMRRKLFEIKNMLFSRIEKLCHGDMVTNKESTDNKSNVSTKNTVDECIESVVNSLNSASQSESMVKKSQNGTKKIDSTVSKRGKSQQMKKNEKVSSKAKIIVLAKSDIIEKRKGQGASVKKQLNREIKKNLSATGKKSTKKRSPRKIKDLIKMESVSSVELSTNTTEVCVQNDIKLEAKCEIKKAIPKSPRKSRLKESSHPKNDSMSGEQSNNGLNLDNEIVHLEKVDDNVTLDKSNPVVVLSKEEFKKKNVSNVNVMEGKKNSSFSPKKVSMYYNEFSPCAIDKKDTTKPEQLKTVSLRAVDSDMKKKLEEGIICAKNYRRNSNIKVVESK